ncbi:MULTISPECIES: colicin immunity protein Cui [Providencia]|uniref:Colicin immunity protein Cui n=1 Tax=Providencia hangzhouensis TaxID=3031799 RepID=A0ABY9Z5S3_9GAMM|nr:MULTISPECIES: colicin immunity protein Cui [Providencia]WNK22926.1 colicin immunity protein Cui [Providencia hangzhouensis]
MRVFKVNTKWVFTIIVLLGAIPLAAIWLNVFSNSTVTNINNWLGELPVIYSDKFPNESYMSALYCKITPLISVLYYILMWNSIEIKKEHFKLYNDGILTLIFGYLSSIFIIGIMTYINYFLDYNISSGNRKLSSISAFEFTSFIYYYAIFISIFIVTCLAINTFIFLPVKYKLKRWG